MEKIIFGIAGKANVGKDTVGSMINYIYHAGITHAKFRDWLMNRNAYLNDKQHMYHFGDTLKDVLSTMFGIDRELFDDRQHKDELYYSMNDRKFLTKEELDNGRWGNFTIFEGNQNMSEFIDIWEDDKIAFKLRTLLQYFATDVCREHLYYNIWSYSCINRILNYFTSIGENSYNKYAIIADTRFYNEKQAIENAVSKHITILINRPNNPIITNHISEEIEFDTDYVIENDGTLQQLFIKVLQLIKQL